MSYDIYLYEKRFLQRALDEDLGDWRNADPISDDKLHVIREGLKSKGYITDDETEFDFPDSKWGLQVSVFKGEVAFGIAYSDHVDAAVEKARMDALELAKATELGFYDPQTGEAFT